MLFWSNQTFEKYSSGVPLINREPLYNPRIYMDNFLREWKNTAFY